MLDPDQLTTPRQQGVLTRSEVVDGRRPWRRLLDRHLHGQRF
jgi:hypothetical protein